MPLNSFCLSCESNQKIKMKKIKNIKNVSSRRRKWNKHTFLFYSVVWSAPVSVLYLANGDPKLHTHINSYFVFKWNSSFRLFSTAILLHSIRCRTHVSVHRVFICLLVAHTFTHLLRAIKSKQANEKKIQRKKRRTKKCGTSTQRAKKTQCPCARTSATCPLLISVAHSSHALFAYLSNAFPLCSTHGGRKTLNIFHLFYLLSNLLSSLCSLANSLSLVRFTHFSLSPQ